MEQEFGLATGVQTQFNTPVVEEKDYSSSEQFSALLDMNIIGHKYLFDNDIKWSYDKEEYSPEEAMNVLNQYNIEAKDIPDLMNESNSLEELSDRAKYKYEVNESAQIVDSMGYKGMALSLGVSLLDIPSYALGGVFGKAAQVGIKAGKFARTGTTVSQGLAGAATGITSIAALEATLGNELTQEQTAITGGLGFFLGYGASRLGYVSPNTDERIATVGSSGVPIKKPILSFLYSDADKMKWSTNPAEVEAGMKASPSMQSSGLQNIDTVTDLDANYNAMTHRSMEEMNDFIEEFENVNGVKFQEADNRAINVEGNKAEFEYIKVRDEETVKLTEQYKPDIDAEVKAELSKVEAEFKYEYTPKTKKITSKSKKKLKSLKNSVKKEVESKWKSKIKAESRVNAGTKLPQILDNVPTKYRRAVDIVVRNGKQFADEINSTKVDGLDVDSNMYWSRKYDTNKIANDYEGAIEAFNRAIRANFNEIDEELADKIFEQARGIVDNIMASKDMLESFDIDSNYIRAKIASTKLNPSQLKGRKIRLNGAELVDYMSNDISNNIKDYGHHIGGKLKAKRVYNIDKNYSADNYAKDNNFSPEGTKQFRNVISATYGTRSIDPRGDTLSSRMVRGMNQINYINLGGFFGVNTLSDLAGIVNDYGFIRTQKYFTKEVINILNKEGTQGKKIAKYLGYSAEGMLGDRAAMLNSGDYGFNKFNKLELGLQQGSNLMSKLSGMNMVVDMMDRTVSVASLDYILKASQGTKFTKNMNRLGLSADDVAALRSSDFVEFDSIGIKDVKLDRLPLELKGKVERALSRAVRDTVIKANDIDTPNFLIEVMGSHALAKVLFQFMKFPVIAYNKLFNKMIHNFDVLDALTATATASMVLGLTTQLKDIGKEDKRYDLSTDDGQMNTAKYVVDRMPHLAPIGLLQTHADVLGRMIAKYQGEEYRSYDKPISHLGVTPSRLADLGGSVSNMLSGNFSSRDAINAKTLLGTNLLWLQPIQNISNDMIKDKLE